MKRDYILFLLMSPFLIACINVDINKPMPSSGTKLHFFESQMIGSYYAEDSTINIGGNAIYNERYVANTHKNNDSTNIFCLHIDVSKTTIQYKLNFKTYYDTNKVKKTIVNYKLIDHYLVVEEKEIHEIVNLDNNNGILINKNGVFYLNIGDKRNSWVILQLVLRSDTTLDINILDYEKLTELPKNFKIEYTMFGAHIKNINNRRFEFLVENGYFKKYLRLKKLA